MYTNEISALSIGSFWSETVCSPPTRCGFSASGTCYSGRRYRPAVRAANTRRVRRSPPINAGRSPSPAEQTAPRTDTDTATWEPQDYWLRFSEMQRASSVQEFARLFAGGDWIRTSSTASNTATPTSHPILQVKHPAARFQPKPGQECRCQQRRVSTSGTIDLHEISRPEILDPGRIQRDHLCARCSSFVHMTKDHHGPGRVVNQELTFAPHLGVDRRLCGFLEFLEPLRQPVSIRAIHTSPR
jgi:hypothetical protein